MKKICLSFLFSAFVAHTSLCVLIGIDTGDIKTPNPDGSFSTVDVGPNASVFLAVTDETTYQTYADNPAGLFQAWQNGEFPANEDYNYFGSTDENGQLNCEFGPFEARRYWYAISIATYTSVETGVEYYIARIREKEYTNQVSEFDVVYFSEAISSAGRWQVIYGEPPAIACTAFAVTNNVVTATYSIDEFSRLNEVVGENAASVVVLSNLAQPDNATNLTATVTGTDSTASTFTLSFNPAEQNWASPTLFIKGVEPPVE